MVKRWAGMPTAGHSLPITELPAVEKAATVSSGRGQSGRGWSDQWLHTIPRKWPLTARSQCQASSAAANEVVQGVIWLLSDLGADTGGKAKHGSDSSCKGQWGLEVGKLRQGLSCADNAGCHHLCPSEPPASLVVSVLRPHSVGPVASEWPVSLSAGH